jgi:hypothetical protein
MVQFLQLKGSNVMDIIYTGDVGYILKINVTYRVDARNIIQAKQEFLQFLSTDFDRTVDKKLGDYGFDSENISIRYLWIFMNAIYRGDKGNI